MKTLALDERRAHQVAARGALADTYGDEALVTLMTEPICRGCGCSDSLACPDGCIWAKLEPYLLCSRCDEDLPPVHALRNPYPPRMVMLGRVPIRMLLDQQGLGWTVCADPRDPTDYIAQWPGQNGHTIIVVP